MFFVSDLPRLAVAGKRSARGGFSVASFPASFCVPCAAVFQSPLNRCARACLILLCASPTVELPIAARLSCQTMCTSYSRRTECRRRKRCTFSSIPNSPTRAPCGCLKTTISIGTATQKRFICTANVMEVRAASRKSKLANSVSRPFLWRRNAKILCRGRFSVKIESCGRRGFAG